MCQTSPSDPVRTGLTPTWVLVVSWITAFLKWSLESPLPMSVPWAAAACWIRRINPSHPPQRSCRLQGPSDKQMLRLQLDKNNCFRCFYSQLKLGLLMVLVVNPKCFFLSLKCILKTIVCAVTTNNTLFKFTWNDLLQLHIKSTVHFYFIIIPFHLQIFLSPPVLIKGVFYWRAVNAPNTSRI